MSARRAAPSQRPSPRKPQGRRIALFGGTFDPIHAGHMAVARAAQRRFRLDQVHFIPCSRPPHKHPTELLPFTHRFAMVTLACSEDPRFVPSLAEAGDNHAGEQVFYSVDTVRRFRETFSEPGDRLYFLLGADAFLKIATWKNYEELLGLCDFVVANRPGFRSDMLYREIAPELLGPPAKGGARRGKPFTIALRNSTVHVLEAVASQVSATDVRRRLERGQSIRRLVPWGVEDYIKKLALYSHG